MSNRPSDQPDVRPELVESDPLLREIAAMVSYLDLHLGFYHWKQLTTSQKELLADLIDSDRVLDPELDGSPGYDPSFTPRWWRDDFVGPLSFEDNDWAAPNPFAGRKPPEPDRAP